MRDKEWKLRLAYRWAFAAVITLLAGCSNPQTGAIPLEDPNASAPQALLALPPTAASLNDIVNDVILTRLDVVLDPKSTVGEIDTALGSIDGHIVTSQPGSLFITVEVPRQSDAAALATLATVLSGFPGISAVIPGREASTRLLPALVDAVPAIDEYRIGHLVLAKFPAAWNAGQLLSNCALDPVPLIIVDKFGALSGFGSELVATINREFPDYTLTGTVLDNGETHGWEVAAMAAAAFDPSAYTGAMPFSGCLDLTLFSVAGISYGQQIDAIDIALQLLGPNAVVNYSLGFKDRCDGDCTAISIADGSSLDDFRQITTSSDRAWYALRWIYETNSMWDQFIVTTAAGDEAQLATSKLYNGLAFAPYNSLISYAVRTEIIGSTQNILWGDAKTPGFEYIGTDNGTFKLLTDVGRGLILDKAADNVIIVGNVDENGDFVGTSDLGEDVSANGTDRLSLSGTTRLSGSSLAAPQVAGLVAYMWALDPQLRTRPMTDTIRAITENQQTSTPQPTLDAYAAVLSMDKNTSSEPPDAPIREAILDVNDDGVFNQDDLTQFANLFRLETAPSPSTELMDWSGYSRVDLNGSGFIDLFSGPDRFDLDPENSTYLGAAVYGIVSFSINGESITLDENKLTDTQILCYYAYSTLYLGDELTRSKLLPSSVCGGSGGEVAFVREQTDGSKDRIIMSADGSRQRLLSSFGNVASYRWSPDKSKIALYYTQPDYAVSDVYVMDSDGTNLTKLTNSFSDSSGFDSSTSPIWRNNTQIIYTRTVSPFSISQTDIINSDGTNREKLLDSSFTPRSVSPDGSKFLGYSAGSTNLSIVSPIGSAPVEIAVQANDPSWSPDGSNIAFRKQGIDLSGSLFVASPDGSNLVELANRAGNDANASYTWSPDSSKIAYRRARNGVTGTDIYIVNADGSNNTLLTDINDFNDNPYWLDDGATIFFRSGNSGGNTDIYSIGADGSNLSNLTNSPTTSDSFPVSIP